MNYEEKTIGYYSDRGDAGCELTDGLTGGLASAFAHMDDAMSELEEEE